MSVVKEGMWKDAIEIDLHMFLQFISTLVATMPSEEIEGPRATGSLAVLYEWMSEVDSVPLGLQPERGSSTSVGQSGSDFRSKPSRGPRVSSHMTSLSRSISTIISLPGRNIHSEQQIPQYMIKS